MKNPSSQAGYTITELLVVLVILGLLAAAISPQILGRLDSSKTRAARLQLDLVSSALDAFHIDVGRFNTNEKAENKLKKMLVLFEDKAVWNACKKESESQKECYEFFEKVSQLLLYGHVTPEQEKAIWRELHAEIKAVKYNFTSSNALEIVNELKIDIISSRLFSKSFIVLNTVMIQILFRSGICITRFDLSVTAPSLDSV